MFRFSAVQCSIRRSRARYILRERKNKETTFIHTSLFRDHSLIRGFYNSLFVFFPISIYAYKYIYIYMHIHPFSKKSQLKNTYKMYISFPLSSKIVFIYIYIYIYIYVYCAQIYFYALSILMNLDVKLKKFEAIHEILVK